MVYVTVLQAIGYLVVLACGAWDLLLLNPNIGGLWELFRQRDEIIKSTGALNILYID